MIATPPVRVMHRAESYRHPGCLGLSVFYRYKIGSQYNEDIQFDAQGSLHSPLMQECS